MAEAAQKVEETPTEINFEDAFARLAELGDDKQPDLTPSEAPKTEEKVEEKAEEPAETAEETADAAPEAPAAKTDAPQTSDDTDVVLQRLAKLVKETPQEDVQPAAAQPAAQPEAPQIYTADEQSFLSNYEKEWPDVARAEQLRRRGEYRDLVNYVFSEVVKELRPIAETVQVLAQRTQLSDLKSAVEDYDTVRDGVISWVEQQPAYLQTAYKHVIENGTVEEVADLVGRYKRESGITAAPAAAAPAARKTETELPSATKQAAAALAPVSSKRSAVAQATDPEDFESAFAAFASKL